MMFKTIGANVMQQLLKMRDFDNTVPAEGIQLVIRKIPFAKISGDPPGCIIGGYATIGEWPRRHAPYDRSIGIFLAHMHRGKQASELPVGGRGRPARRL